MSKMIGVTSAFLWRTLLMLLPISNAFASWLDNPGSLAISSSCGLKADWITPNFQSTNIAEVLKAFKSIKPKDEFEASTDYNNRVTKELGGAANFSQCATLAFYKQYDVDQKRMTLSKMADSDLYYGKSIEPESSWRSRYPESRRCRKSPGFTRVSLSLSLLPFLYLFRMRPIEILPANSCTPCV